MSAIFRAGTGVVTYLIVFHPNHRWYYSYCIGVVLSTVNWTHKSVLLMDGFFPSNHKGIILFFT